MNTSHIETEWDGAEPEVLMELCRAARVSELLANIPWRQISSGFQKRLQEAWEKKDKL